VLVVEEAPQGAVVEGAAFKTKNFLDLDSA
jgi:hypothetical protein